MFYKVKKYKKIIKILKNIVEKPCDYTVRVLKFITNCINIHIDGEICSLLIAIFRLIFGISNLEKGNFL